MERRGHEAHERSDDNKLSVIRSRQVLRFRTRYVDELYLEDEPRQARFRMPKLAVYSVLRAVARIYDHSLVLKTRVTPRCTIGVLAGKNVAGHKSWGILLPSLLASRNTQA